MLRKTIISFLLLQVLCSSLFLLQAVDLKHSRDSLESLLRQTPANDDARRLELLNHLCDIDLALGDTTYIYPCWQASVRQRDVNSMDDLLIPLAMRAMGREQQDSVSVWLERTRLHFDTPLANCNREYLLMMQDLRDWENYDKLAERMLKEQVRLDAENEPYQSMRVLYTLGIISSFEKSGNASTTLKPSLEYMAEALAIARKQPFREAAHFTRQILLGLGSESVDYARQYLAFVQKFLNEPDMKKRPFYSRRALISAHEKLITMGADLPREELDGYYREIRILLKQYPNDTPTRPDYFRARVHFRYNKAVGNAEEALQWCDSLITLAPSNRVDPAMYYGDKMRLLAQLHRYEEAYRYAGIYMLAKDSMQNVSSEKKLSELQTQYDVDTLRRKEEARFIQLLYVSACVLLLVAVLVVYIVYSRRLAKKNLILLEQLKQYTLKLKAEEAERLKAQEAMAEAQATQAAVIAQTIEPLAEDTADDNNNASTASLKLFIRIDTLVREKKLYLHADFNRTNLLDSLGVNKNNLAAAVMAGAKCSLSDYINELRLRNALLVMEEDQEMPLAQVADQMGFGTYSSFYRAFNKRFGVSPKEYKKFVASE